MLSEVKICINITKSKLNEVSVTLFTSEVITLRIMYVHTYMDMYIYIFVFCCDKLVTWWFMCQSNKDKMDDKCYQIPCYSVPFCII